MTKLSDLGEKAVVSKIISGVGDESAVGPGDDAAAIDMGDFYLVITTDLISKRTHMPEQISCRQVGWTAAAVNFSDVASMGAEPLGLVLAMGLPRETEYDRLKEIIDGASECCESIGSSLLGGDTKECPELTLTGTALGRVERDRILLRSGAREGDLLGVTGPLGRAGAGWYAIRSGMKYEEGVRALLEPIPRVREGRSLAESGVVTSCIDISDGLAYSIHHLSESSGVSFSIDYQSLPVGKEVSGIAQQAGVSVEEVAVYYGGDYQLLFTFKPRGVERLESLLGEDFAIIGRVKDEGENIIVEDDEIRSLERRGYEHFI